MARMVLGGELPRPGAAIDEPAAGTGGMIRATAHAIRALGGDPRNYTWSMADIDRYAIACCAINAWIWGLGRQVLLFCGDTLATGDGPVRAARMRDAVLAHHREHLSRAHRLVATDVVLEGLRSVLDLALPPYRYWRR